MSSKDHISPRSADELSESSDSSWATAPSHQTGASWDDSDDSRLQSQQCHDLDVLTGRLKSFELGSGRKASRLSRSLQSLAPSPSRQRPRFLSADDGAASTASQDDLQMQQHTGQSGPLNQETRIDPLHEATQAGYNAMLNQIHKARMDQSRRKRSRLIRARYVELAGQSSLSSQRSQTHTSGVLKNVQTPNLTPHTISGRQTRRVARRSHQIGQRANASEDSRFEHAPAAVPARN